MFTQVTDVTSVYTDNDVVPTTLVPGDASWQVPDKPSQLLPRRAREGSLEAQTNTMAHTVLQGCQGSSSSAKGMPACGEPHQWRRLKDSQSQRTNCPLFCWAYGLDPTHEER